MNSNFEFKLNSAGVRQLLKSEEMQSVLSEYGSEVASNAGSGFEKDERIYKKRAVVNVYPKTEHARIKDYKENSLLKAVGKTRRK